MDVFDKLNNKCKLYFIDIGNNITSAIASLCFENGYPVEGFSNLNGEYLNRIKEKGITVDDTFELEKLKNYDVIIFTNKKNIDESIVSFATKNGISILNEYNLLAYLMSFYNRRVGVSGAHGKSTVVSMLYKIFEKTNPGFICEADNIELNANYSKGADDLFIFDALDDNNAYLRTNPNVSVLLNCEYNDDDFYSTTTSFETFVQLPFKDDKKDGVIVYNRDEEKLHKIVYETKKIYEDKEDANFLSISYGLYQEETNYRAINLVSKNGCYRFDIRSQGDIVGTIKLKIPGLYNVYNALAAYAIADSLGANSNDICNTLSNFQGANKRFECVGKTIDDVLVYLDYSHHPKEISTVIDVAKEITDGGIVVIYEPSSYKRTKEYYDEYKKALEKADSVIIVDFNDVYSNDNYGLDAQKMADDIKGGYYAPNYESAAKVAASMSDGGAIIIMGEGNVYLVSEYLLDN